VIPVCDEGRAVNPFDPETWKQQWAAFWSAPFSRAGDKASPEKVESAFVKFRSANTELNSLLRNENLEY
jgi:hypothetical protein